MRAARIIIVLLGWALTVPDWLQTQFVDKDDLELSVILHLPSAGIAGCTTHTWLVWW